jgi:hypothetical protein
LAESGITLGQYFNNISKEIIHIEDEVIGMPPELKGKPIYDHLAY